MSLAFNIEADTLDQSSFSTLIRQEEQEELVHIDVYTACLIGDIDAIKGFVDKKCDLNRHNTGGWTPLMYAAFVGRESVLNMLLDANVKTDIPAAKDGMTAMMFAAYCAGESVMYYLIQRGASLNARDKNGLTALFHAVKQGHTNAVKLLLGHGADLELSQYHTNITPLMEAAIEGHEVIFRLLLEHGANVDARSRKGENVRSLAMRYGHTMVVNIMDEMHSERPDSLRSEAKLGGSDSSLFRPKAKRELRIGDGPEAISRLLQNNRIDKVTPNIGDGYNNNEAVAALCQDYSKFIINQDPPRSQQQQNVPSLPLSLESRPQSVLPEVDIKRNFERDFNPSRMSRVAMEPPKVMFPQHQQKVPDVPLPVETLRELLEEFKLEAHLEKFESQGIDLTTFLELTDAELKEIGIDKLGPRKKSLIAMTKYKERLRFHKGTSVVDQCQVDQAQVELQAMAMKLQQAYQYIKQLQNQLYSEQQYHSEMDRYCELEHNRMSQVLYNIQDVGKSCMDAMSHLKKLRDHNSKVCMHLSKLRESAEGRNPLAEEDRDGTIHEAGNSIKCELEIVYNRLEMAYQLIERTLATGRIKTAWQ